MAATSLLFDQSSQLPNSSMCLRHYFLGRRQQKQTNGSLRSALSKVPQLKANRKETIPKFHRAHSTLHSIDAPHARKYDPVQSNATERACSGRCYAFFVSPDRSLTGRSRILTARRLRTVSRRNPTDFCHSSVLFRWNSRFVLVAGFVGFVCPGIYNRSISV